MSEKKIDMLARHKARKFAVQAIYQWQLAQNCLNEIEKQFIEQFEGKRVDVPYFLMLFHEVPKNLTSLDDAFAQHISRTINEIDPVELAILRIASYELLNRPEIPYKVVINEALELTKTYGSTDGFKFVNGVLDKTAKDIRKLEHGQ